MCEQGVGAMRKGMEVSGVVERVDFPNRGLVLVQSSETTEPPFRVRVKGVIEGQQVRILITRANRGKNRFEGRLLAVTEASPIETEQPLCPHFVLCGGCSYQTLPVMAQRELKAAQVCALLPEGAYSFDGIFAGEKAFEYRNKMEFSFGDDRRDGPLTLGLHRRGSFYDVITTEQCCLVAAPVRAALRCVLSLCTERGLRYFHKRTHEGYLRHLLIRRSEATGELLLGLVTTAQWTGEGTETQFLEALVARLLELGEVQLEAEPVRFAGILHIQNDGVADVVRADRLTLLYGQDYFTERVLGLSFCVTPFSFFQTNTGGAEVLYERVRAYVGEKKNDLIYDLYSGTGTIAQLLAPVAQRVVGVEIVAEAVEAARQNAALNGLENCTFIAGDVLQVLDTLPEKPDMIVLDPPRDGVHQKALAKIIAYGVERMIYISCKPTSLARDLALLREGGYMLERVCCVDLFVQGLNVETVALLSHKSPMA